MKINKIISILVIILFVAFSCQKEGIENNTTIVKEYSISGRKILHNNNPIQFVGANAFHSFGVGSKDMNAWNMDIVREFIGNIKENPISGTPIQDSNGSWLHSLQSIVDDNKQNNKVTILCAFGWNGIITNEFTGLMPTQTFWWNDYKTKLQQWAIQFKDQPNVWIEVWNEPYRWDRADGYTDDIWLNDMNQMVSNIRNVGNNNIIIVPCAEQGQDESVLINKGTQFLNNKTNILFDIHAYEKWLTVNNATQRLDGLDLQNIPYFIGEIAPKNASVLMNPQPLLDNLYNRGKTICAWAWKNDDSEQDALLTTTGYLPNNNNNNNWGTTYKQISTRVRTP